MDQPVTELGRAEEGGIRIRCQWGNGVHKRCIMERREADGSWVEYPPPPPDSDFPAMDGTDWWNADIPKGMRP